MWIRPLFPLYLAQGVPNIVGVDISRVACAIARSKYPEVKIYRIRLEELRVLGSPDGYFDLGIRSRTPQHVPPENFGQVIKPICALCRWIYVNQLADSDDVHHQRGEIPFHLFHHDYVAEFILYTGFAPI